MKISELNYNLQRFGISPSRFFARYREKLDNIFIISIPKSGTHFVESLLINVKAYRRSLKFKTINIKTVEEYGGLEAILKNKYNTLFFSHLPYEEEYFEILQRHRCKIVFVFRDPRDVTISEANYVAAQPNHQWHRAFVKPANRKESYKKIIRGDVGVKMPSLLAKYKLFKGWRDQPTVSSLQYEQLYLSILNNEKSELREQLDFVNLSESQLDEILRKTINPSSPTFLKPGIQKFMKDPDFPLDVYNNARVSELKDFEYTGAIG